MTVSDNDWHKPYLRPRTVLPFAFRLCALHTVAIAEIEFSAPYVVLWQRHAKAFSVRVAQYSMCITLLCERVYVLIVTY